MTRPTTTAAMADAPCRRSAETALLQARAGRKRVIDDEHPLAAESARHGEGAVVSQVVIRGPGAANQQRLVPRG